MRIWALVKKDHKTVGQAEQVIFHKGDWTSEDIYQHLEGVCLELDLARPIVLKKHARELTQFFQTNFKKHDFAESIAFDRLEVHVIED